MKRDNNFANEFNDELEYLDGYSDWMLNAFLEVGYFPNNTFEANWVLNDAILELGKHKSFLVDYSSKEEKKSGIKKIATLTEENCLDIFYSPIWNKTNLKVKANCVNWAFKKLALQFGANNYKLTFIEVNQEGTENYGLTDSEIKKIYVDISKKAHSVLNALVHELTHAKHNNVAEPYGDIFTRIKKLNFFFLASSLTSDTDMMNDFDLDFNLYEINLGERAANSNAYSFRKKMHKLLTEKYGENKAENHEFYCENKIYEDTLSNSHKVSHGQEDRLNRLNVNYIICSEQYEEAKETLMDLNDMIKNKLKEKKDVTELLNLKEEINHSAKYLKVIIEKLRKCTKKIYDNKVLTKEENAEEENITKLLNN